ncbi:MAG: hypothetical protein PHV66_02740 [Bacteroidales bacterium]|nr:hypothetical protein [Bacteroidales bacterium]
MNRLNFIKRLGTLLAVSAMPVSASALNKEEKYFKFDDIFYRPYPNKNLLYLKPGCKIDSYLRNKIEGQVTDKNETSCVYLGLNDLILPFTEKYTLADFDYVVRSIKRHTHEKLCKPMIRFFNDKDGLHPTIFLWYEQQYSIRTKS